MSKIFVRHFRTRTLSTHSYIDSCVNLHLTLRQNNLPVSESSVKGFFLNHLLDPKTKPHKWSDCCEAVVNVVDHPEGFSAAMAFESYGNLKVKLRGENDQPTDNVVMLPKVYTSWGVHPLNSHFYTPAVHDELKRYLSRKPATKINEKDPYQVYQQKRANNNTISLMCGLDYIDTFHRNAYVGRDATKDVQKSVMCKVLDLAKEIFPTEESISKTLTLHIRGKAAAMDALHILKTYFGNKNTDLRLVIIPFTEDMDVAEAFLEAFPRTKFGICGLHVSGRDVAAQSMKTVIGVPGSSVAGVGKQEQDDNAVAEFSRLRQLPKQIGLDKIVLATNSPYMAPDPFRSTHNHPGLVPFIISKISKSLQVDELEVYTQALKNTTEVFAL